FEAGLGERLIYGSAASRDHFDRMLEIASDRDFADIRPTAEMAYRPTSGPVSGREHRVEDAATGAFAPLWQQQPSCPTTQGAPTNDAGACDALLPDPYPALPPGVADDGEYLDSWLSHHADAPPRNRDPLAWWRARYMMDPNKAPVRVAFIDDGFALEANMGTGIVGPEACGAACDAGELEGPSCSSCVAAITDNSCGNGTNV